MIYNSKILCLYKYVSKSNVVIQYQWLFFYIKYFYLLVCSYILLFKLHRGSEYFLDINQNVASALLLIF